MKPVIGYEDEYSVTEDGRVFRMLNRRGGVRKPYDPPLEMKPRTNAQGYLCISLCKDGKVSNRRVSRLVLEAHKGSPASQFLVAAHLDGNKLNNHASNLDWVTYEENESHKRRHGTTGRGERNSFAKLSDAQIAEIRRLAAAGVPKARLVGQFNVSRSAIDQVVNGKYRNEDSHYFKKLYLEAIAREKVLRDALAWYVQEDDVIESMAGNEYWVEGRNKAIDALALPPDSTALDSAIRKSNSEIEQAITDPENQPSQYGTVTLAYHDKHLADMQDEIDRATLYATELATSLHRKLYADVTQWKSLPDLYGLLSQIDNMMCGIDSAIKQAKLEALQSAIAEWEKPYGMTDGSKFIDRLIRMAEKLK